MANIGKLYVVATPIGNLGDITKRALDVLGEVQLIAAEDTRQSKKLLNHYGIHCPLYSLHAHNERLNTAKMINTLESGQNVAYITDAGTPLISDPGAFLVKSVRASGYQVVPIPGPCAAIAALSVSGFRSPHFYFEGFLPNKSSERCKRLVELETQTATLIFYEAPHRILAVLADMIKIFGDRCAVIGRELTKKFETVLDDSLSKLIELIDSNPEQQRGEFVILVAGNESLVQISEQELERVLMVLLKELPLKVAVAVACDILKMNKNMVYQKAIAIKNDL